MADVEKLRELATANIDKHADDLYSINQQIHAKPEIAHQEVFAHQLLTSFLAKQGFQVEQHYALETAFKATLRCGKGPNVAVLCEYDALPKIGHGCGHNLIAEAGIGAAIGIQAAMKAIDEGRDFGTLTVYGTPAEEGLGGKIAMIKHGCFNGVDFAMMVHGSSFDAGISNLASMLDIGITYHGRNAHAALCPWDGINAVDAAVYCYNSISAMRQHFKPTWRVHGIITDGGKLPSIIPDQSQMQFYLRALSEKDLHILLAKCESCFRGAATATGCTVDIQYRKVHNDHYICMLNNLSMANRYEQHASRLGVQFPSYAQQLTLPAGSSDMGNISQLIPSIHPFFDIGTKVPKHSSAFTEASATAIAHEKTLIAAKSMALVAIDIFTDPQFRQQIIQEFNDAKVDS
ncbi:Peptidase M20 domain-containing protein 2 [Trichoplax sp. H2]|uniref:Peptidase M20 domain-containing protein 2 n=1 Tax=Trichoplax adhaerens TaxID=10228 RepID=B3RVG5_TRIAD|nr:hypothetical protein TRIADDRAFT_23576 [Trichoplax adhaerens]EDV25496.1 hypothetical protein TRIADDRAFT_23576 [Trichoplax adhaerens]RDD46882.1 Peptidase M20 domain-containing protein 2 [Trichoplax sp. H2]|eukprot:XP_002111529.1 hypothetical protein TRIADDRAFT_23576 [Trichoplax adhaerens]